VVVCTQEAVRQALTMYPVSGNVDKMWEVATMLAHREFHPVHTATSATAAAAMATRFNMNGNIVMLFTNVSLFAFRHSFCSDVV